MKPNASPIQAPTPAPVERPPAERKWLLPAALCAITLVAYINSFGLGLALDSQAIIHDDPRIRDITAENLRNIAGKPYWWPKPVDLLYRPLTTASFLFNYTTLSSGVDAAGYHWVNFLLHLTAVLLVFSLAARLLKNRLTAFFAAALWAVHPIGTETVANIAGRADLLATIAILAGLLLYARMQGTVTRARAIAVFLAAAAAVFSKETGATFLGLILLWDLAFAADGWRETARRRLPAYAAAAAAVLAFLYFRMRAFDSTPYPETPFLDNPILGANFLQAKLTAIKTIGRELWLLVWPVDLSFDRSYNQLSLASAGDPLVWLALAVIVGIVVLVVARRRKDPLLFWAAGFLGITLLPVSNLLFPIGSIMAERFLYLPSIGFAIAVAALAGRLRQPRTGYAVLGVVIALFGVRTFARNPVWASDVTLGESGVKSAPRSFRTHELLARGLFRAGGPGHLDKRAITEGEAAWAIIRDVAPENSFYQTPGNLGMYYQVAGDAAGGASTPEGRGWYEKAVAMLRNATRISQATEKAHDAAQKKHGKPLPPRLNMTEIYFNLGSASAKLGRYDEAIRAYRYAKDMNPSDPEVYDALSAIYMSQENWRQAVIVLEEKTQVDGFKPATVRNIAGLYGKIPGGDCAVLQAGSELKINPGCQPVWEDLCAGWADLGQSFVQARQPDAAHFLKDRSVNKYSCPAGPFSKLP